MMKSIGYNLAAGIFILMTGSAAVAATVTSNLNVRLTIASGCGIALTTDVDFGLQNYVVGQLTAQGSVTVICTNGLSYTVALDGGQANNINSRRMVNGASSVVYQLYQDSAHQIPWGNLAENSLAGSGTGLPQILPVYGLITGPQATVAGAYLDTVIVTLSY